MVWWRSYLRRIEVEYLGSLLPDIEGTTRTYSYASPSAFLLFAIMSLCSIHSVRLAGQTAILRTLACDPTAETSFLSDRIDIAEKRSMLLAGGVRLCCYAAFGALLVMLILMVAGATAARHVFAVPVVFLGVLVCLLLSVVQVVRDVKLEMLEVRLYRLAPDELAVWDMIRLRNRDAFHSADTLESWSRRDAG